LTCTTEQQTGGATDVTIAATTMPGALAPARQATNNRDNNH